MRANRTSGSMSGRWKRGMVRLVRHRQTKEPATDRPHLTYRATARLYRLLGALASSGSWLAITQPLSRVWLRSGLGVCLPSGLSPRSIRKAPSLGSWLRGVAYRTARRAQTEFARRHKHERRAVRREGSSPDDMTWPEVQQVLHEELSGLSERYRAPLTLR